MASAILAKPAPYSVIFIGRFQPLHLGHEHVIRELVKRYGTLTIGIGSANAKESRLLRNPFTLQERMEMIGIALGDLGGKIVIVPVEDKHHDKKWAEHVASIGNFTHFVTDNDWVRRCLSGRLEEIPYPGMLERDSLEGTKIRHAMAVGEEWESKVSPDLVAHLRGLNAEELMAELLKEHVKKSRVKKS